MVLIVEKFFVYQLWAIFRDKTYETDLYFE